jgi:hypothetical protein
MPKGEMWEYVDLGGACERDLVLLFVEHSCISHLLPCTCIVLYACDTLCDIMVFTSVSYIMSLGLILAHMCFASAFYSDSIWAIYVVLTLHADLMSTLCWLGVTWVIATFALIVKGSCEPSMLENLNSNLHTLEVVINHQKGEIESI